MAEGLKLKGRYSLDPSPLVPGGMGEIYAATDHAFNRRVIVKFVNRAMLSHDLLKRFRREAELTARLRHPAVPAVYDLDTEDGRPYLVMESIEGTPLDALVAEHGPLPLGWVCAIGAQVSSVLIAADELGIVHRDIKPANIMIETGGAVRVLDFGIAAIYGDDRYSRITRTGESPGTLVYMAPEQLAGEACTHKSDLYSLAITLFELLMGELPVDGDTAAVREHRFTPPPRLNLLKPDLPEQVDELLCAMLAPNPADRPAHALDVFEVLTGYVGDLPPLVGITTGEVTGRSAYNTALGLVCPPRPTRATDRISLATADVRRRAAGMLDNHDVDNALALLESFLGAPATTPATRSRDLLEIFELYATALRAAGRYRAAARHWRGIAQRHEEIGGADDLRAYECRLQAALVHLDLKEPDRAINQLNALLRDRLRIDGPDAERVVRLRDEIARLSVHD